MGLQGLRQLEAAAWQQATQKAAHTQTEDMLLLRERRKVEENRTSDFGELRMERSSKGLVKTQA